MNYAQALQYVNALQGAGIRFGLSRIRRVLKELGDPHKHLKIIHIAGTNGKGSTAAFLSSILCEQGYRVGLYTSPHLNDLRERIRIVESNECGKDCISTKDIAQLIEYIAGKIESLQLQLTFFEFITVIAFLYFAIGNADYVILEVGMGGRLDATNAISAALVSIITNIDYDHMSFLGKSLERIAREKAGIIKRNSNVITAVKQKKILKIFRNICSQKKAKLINVCSREESVRLSSRTTVFDYRGLYNNFNNLKISLTGRHQIDNALCALAAVEVMQKNGVTLSLDSVYKGLSKAFWPGRLELINNILLDGAHNPAGMRSLVNTLNSGVFQMHKLVLVIGILRDKDITNIIKELQLLNNIYRIIITRPDCDRAQDTDVLTCEFNRCFSHNIIICEETIEDAIKKARGIVTHKDLICITGSLYTVGEARNILLQEE